MRLVAQCDPQLAGCDVQTLRRRIEQRAHALAAGEAHERIAREMDERMRLEGEIHSTAAREQQRLSVLHGRLRHAVLFKMQRLTQSQQAVEARLPQAMQRHLAAQKERLARCALRLDLLAPQRVLERGYAILCDAQGHTVTSVQQAHTDDTLQAQLADGRLELRVQAPHPSS